MVEIACSDLSLKYSTFFQLVIVSAIYGNRQEILKLQNIHFY